jgi:hypothetical protein
VYTALMKARHELSTTDAGRDCGRKRIGGLVSVRVGSRGARFEGLRSCGSTWACPRCSRAIRARRAAEIEKGVAEALRRGYVVFFPTYTTAHSLADPLADLLDDLSQGYNALHYGRSGRDFRTEFGVIGSIKATETTIGDNGWHPHLHVPVICRPWTDEQRANIGGTYYYGVQGQQLYMASWLNARWSRTMRDRGITLDGPPPIVVEHVTSNEGVGAYVTKMTGEHVGLGAEVAMLHTKAGRAATSVTPFGMLANYATSENPNTRRLWAARWREYERATSGKHAIRWSPGLAAELGVRVMTDDEIIAAMEQDGVIVAQLDEWQWRAIRRAGLTEHVLDLAECGRVGTLYTFVKNVLRQEHLDAREPALL